MIHNSLVIQPVYRFDLVRTFAIGRSLFVFTQENHVNDMTSIISYKGRTIYECSLIFNLDSDLFEQFAPCRSLENLLRMPFFIDFASYKR